MTLKITGNIQVCDASQKRMVIISARGRELVHYGCKACGMNAVNIGNIYSCSDGVMYVGKCNCIGCGATVDLIDEPKRG